MRPRRRLRTVAALAPPRGRIGLRIQRPDADDLPDRGGDVRSGSAGSSPESAVDAIAGRIHGEGSLLVLQTRLQVAF